MLTNRGWAIAVGSLSLLIAGRLVGIRELFELGLGLATLVAASIVLVRLGRHENHLSRDLLNAGDLGADLGDVYPGTPVQVAVSITARRTSPPLLFVEHLPPDLAEGVLRHAGPRETGSVTRRGPGASPPAGSARRAIAFPVGALPAGGTHHITYQVVPERRGRYEIGPGSTVITDPFALARARERLLATSTLVVLPPFEELVGLPGAATGPDGRLFRQPPSAGPVGSGEDFFTMREYQPGDDVKKIHWRSTARRGRMMVRQEDRPGQSRVIVLLDDRRAAHAGGAGGLDSFEACITSAASVVALFNSQDLSFGLALASETSEAADTGHPAAGLPDPFDQGLDHERALMRRLALLRASGTGDLAAALRALLGPRQATTLVVVVTPFLDQPGEVEACSVGRSAWGDQGPALVVVRHPRHTFCSPDGARSADPSEAEGAAMTAQNLLRAGVALVDVAAGESLKAAWNCLAGAPSRAGAPVVA